MKKSKLELMIVNAESIVNFLEQELQSRINELESKNKIKWEWFKQNKLSSPRSILHSRILGILSRINFGEEWIVDIERKLKPNMKGWVQFAPDIVVWLPENKIGIVIEYYSIDSSDSTIIDKDLKNYKKYINNCDKNEDGCPFLWVIITTLKDGPVKDWSKWPWRKGGRFYKKDKLLKALYESPLSFWRDRYYIKELDKASKYVNHKCALCWMNIDSGKVKIEWKSWE